MRTKLYLFTLSLVLSLSLGSFQQTFACGSYQYAPSVCEMYGKSKAVFVGKIVDITEIKKENSSSDFKIDFQVQEAFLGVKKMTRVPVLLSGTSLEYCGFERSKSYLVYAYKGDYGFSLDSGTRTKAVTNAEEDLEFLRNLAKAPAGARVYGTITRAVKSSLEEDNQVPVSGMRLKVESLGENPRTFYATTDTNGHFELKIPGGKYKISPAKPLVGYYFSPKIGFGEIEVNDKGCVGYNFKLTTDNKFVGKVIDAEGNPVVNADIEILSINAKKPEGFIGDEYTQTSFDGTFYAYNITPGLYTVSINYSRPPDNRNPFPPVFYPGVSERSQAAVIEIKGGIDITDFEFRLPPRLNPKTIKGSVVWADGTPAVGVSVDLKDDEYVNCCVNGSAKTDEQGRFTLVGYEGRHYRICGYAEKMGLNNSDLYGVSKSFLAESSKTHIIIMNLTEEQFEKDLDEEKTDGTK